jgi:ParB family chromosome partitioning protein
MAVSKKPSWTDMLGSEGTAKDGATGEDTEGPKEPPVTVYMHTIVGNPANPRPEEDYTDADPEFSELKASMKAIGQLQPVGVLSRPVFEQAKADTIAASSPRTRKLIQEADWVVVTGNRRLAAARQLGWTRIDIRVHDQLGDEDGRIDEAVIIENIHRKKIAPIREAEFLSGMFDRYGSQEKVAERIGKSQVYVSQRLALLKLAPDVQEDVDKGKLKIKEARQLAGQTSDHDEQRARAAELKARAAEPKPPRARVEQPVQNPVLETVAVPQPTSVVPSVQNPVLNEPTEVVEEQRPEGVPEPREAVTVPSERPAPKMFPYSDGTEAGMHLLHKMPPEERAKVYDMLGKDEATQAARVS